MHVNTILVVGNSVDPQDSLPIRILPQLRKMFPDTSFIPWDPTEELPFGIGKDIVLIDTMLGIESIQIFESLEDFALSPHTTVHDFDLPIALGILKKIGKLGNIRIIAIPPHFPVHLILRKCEAQLIQGS